MKHLFNTFINFDAPMPWGIYFQDSATPQMEGLVELHDNIMYYLVLILFAVGWILFSIIKNFASTKTQISHKYLNHGRDVPTQKCFKFNSIYKFFYNNHRSYSTTSSSPISSVKFYEDAFSMRKLIIKDNKDKSGIYKWTNKITNDIYIGQSISLAKRFIRYFNLSYLKNRETLVISRALIKYGYSNFSLEILEYCDIANLTEREQYYMDKLNPRYNTLKIAGSSSGHKLSEETKTKISGASSSLKGVYIQEKSALYGRTHTEETKALMSSNNSNENNPLFGKTHSLGALPTKELMRQKALGRKHSEETLLKMSTSRGHLVYIHEKCDSEGFKLIGSFVSIRKAAKFLDISANTVRLYINSGEIFKDRYKFTGDR
jgi:group I intron endonuclease